MRLFYIPGRRRCGYDSEMRHPIHIDLEKRLAETKGRYLSIWLLFAAGTMLTFALGFLLGTWHCPVR